ncbi:MAG: ribonuclease HI [Planctomycetaceae bacterium]|nr:ribonuclease HI [Planctomycetaceae bacterium]
MDSTSDDIRADDSQPDEQPVSSPKSAPFVELYTDGACRGNPGPGGWAYILRHPVTKSVKECSGGTALTTNNLMELQALIEGLKALNRPSRVEVITDSTYVAKGCQEWLPNWKKNGWRRREGKSWKPLKNQESWEQLDLLLQKHQVKFTVVRGHTGHPENERCDELAVAAALQYA